MGVSSVNLRALIVALALWAGVCSAVPVLASASSPCATDATMPQCVYFFYADGCQSCERASAYIDQLQQNYTSLTITRFELHNSTNFQLMKSFYDFHNISNYAYPVIFIGNEVLIQPSQIEERLVPLLDNNTGWVCPSYNSTVPPYQAAKDPPLSIVAGMAFADSMNPCAISVLLLLIVTISTTSASLWKAGLAYILGNFAAYLAIGFGMFTLLQQFHLPAYTTKVVAVLAIIVAIVSLYSKLPVQTKPTIKRLIAGITSPIFAFIAGAIISIIELPCSGGPYFLTLTLMSQYQITQLQLLAYLLFYNIIFVLPLVAVLLLYLLTKSPKIPKKYIRWTSAIVMFVMGVILFFL
jgi:cytochrome c biogenesis protein CcdA